MAYSDRKVNPGKRVKGSAVVEMSYLIPMLLFLFVLIVHAVFYYHDKVILTGAAGETAVLGAQMARKEGAEFDPEQFFRTRSQNRLIFMTNVSVRVSRTEDEITVAASAEKSFMKLNVVQSTWIVRPEKKIRMAERLNRTGVE